VQSTAYDVAGRVTLRQLGSSPALYTQYSYYPWTTANGQGRLLWLKTGEASGYDSLQKMQYMYDAVGNVTNIYDHKTGSTVQTQYFTYDELDRLKTARASGGTGGTYSTQTYSYNQIGNLTNNGDGTLTYGTQSASCPGGALSKPHAVVTATGSLSTYCYDANGNQTTRTFLDTSTLTYDAENRLTTMSGAKNASFVYDGDGNRVKSVLNGTTTYYVGSHFEWTGSTTSMVKYYYAGGQRVAMRVGSNAPSFLLGDHLGSTSLTANSSGARVSSFGRKFTARFRPKFTRVLRPKFTTCKKQQTPEDKSTPSAITCTKI
jgi:hypothetical protein